MELGRSPQDIKFLRDVSGVAAMAHAPFIASMKPEMLDLDSFTDLERPIDIAKIFDTTEMAAWNSLRNSEDSRYLALAAPRVLVRLPWGPETAPVEGLDFVEEVDGTDHTKYLWGPASWNVGSLIMKSFSQYGWPCAIRGTETGGKIADLPLHFFESLSGAKIAKCPTETTITDRREKELSDQGIIGIVHAKNTDYSVVFSGATANRPRKYVEDEANANARLSAMLPYILATSRFAHFLKAIMRDRVGGFSSREEIEQYLNRWISQYVTEDDTATPRGEGTVSAARSANPDKGGAGQARGIHLGVPPAPALPAGRAHGIASTRRRAARRKLTGQGADGSPSAPLTV